MTAPALTITPLSPIATAAVFCRLAGTLWATVVAKATFQLVHGETARLVAALPLVMEEQANAANGGLEKARETAPHLPNAGVLLTGHAYAPDGRAVPSMSVRLGISRDRPLIDKTLHVFGARAAAAPSAITPFQKMPLVYERAFGGAGVWENPVGTGGPGSSVLPNIIDPKDPRRVAGFGPIARQWSPRRALFGSADPAAPGAAVWDVPAGFDWRFFQAAPADQQLDRFRGDEWIILDGMRPNLTRVQSRLPQVTALARRQSTGAGPAAEQPIDLRADMLVIDADHLTASMIWRGRFVVESAAALARMRVLVGLEQPGQPAAWPAAPTPVATKAPTISAETQEINLSTLLGSKVPFAADRESSLASPSTDGPKTPSFTGTAAVDLREVLRTPVPFSAASAAPETMELAALGPAGLATVLGAPILAAMASPAAPTMAGTIDAIPVPPALLPFEPGDPSRPPSESIPSPASQKSTPTFTGTTDINVAHLMKAATPYPEAAGASSVRQSEPASPVLLAPIAPPSAPAMFEGRPAELVRPALPAPVSEPPAVPVGVAVAPGEPIEPPALLTPPAAPPAGASALVNAPPREAAVTRAQVEADLAAGRVLDGADLAGANLSGVDFSGRSFARCNLRGARLQGAKLQGAKLANAILDEADLRGALLSGADLTEASFLKANLERADLSKCSAERAQLQDANLTSANLRSGRFSKAVFAGATLRDAQGGSGDFTGADFEGADLTDARFRFARAGEATFARAVMDRADFQNAHLRGANLRDASRRMIKLAGADLTGAGDTENGGRKTR